MRRRAGVSAGDTVDLVKLLRGANGACIHSRTMQDGKEHALKLWSAQQLYWKVSLAVAILRNKPPGQDAESYTRELCRMHEAGRGTLSQTVKSLEEQLLTARQQQVRERLHITTPASHGNVGSPADSTPTQVARTTATTAPMRAHSSATEPSLARNIEFVRKLSQLVARYGTSSSDCTASALHSEDLDVLCASLESLAASLPPALSDVPRKLLSQCLKAIAACMVSTSHDGTEDAQRVKVEAAVAGVVSATLQRVTAPNPSAADRESRAWLSRELAAAANTSPHMWSVTLACCINHLGSFSDSARRLANCADVDPGEFEGLAHVFDITEELITSALTANSVPGGADLGGMRECIERSVRGMQDALPLYAKSLWQLWCSLSALQR